MLNTLESKRMMMSQVSTATSSYIQLPTVPADSLCRLTAWTDIPFHTAEVNGFAVLMDNDPLNNGYKLIPDSKKWVGQNVYINNNIYQWDLPVQYRTDLNNVFAPKQQIPPLGVNWRWNQQPGNASISSFLLNCNQERTINMAEAFSNQQALIGEPVCGNNVISMVGAYAGCSSLTGSPVCGSNVINMSEAQRNCYNLTGLPACGNNVIEMGGAYWNCTNLTPCGNNNLYLLNNQLISFSQAFRSTPILDQPTSVQIQSEAENCTGQYAFNRPSTYPSLNIYLKRNGGLAQAIANGSEVLQGAGWPAALTSRADGNGWQDTATNLYIYNNLGE